MEFVQTNEEMYKVLFWALDIKSPIKCEYCDEMVTPQTCGGLMCRFENGNNTPVILCKSILCMSSYFTYNEDKIKLDELKEVKI